MKLRPLARKSPLSGPHRRRQSKVERFCCEATLRGAVGSNPDISLPVRYEVIDDTPVRRVDEDGRREGVETIIEAGANHRAVAVALARKQWRAAHPNGDFLIRDLEYEDQYNAPVRPSGRLCNTVGGGIGREGCAAFRAVSAARSRDAPHASYSTRGSGCAL